MTSPLALYIHWPFCLKKCPYCDFNSHVRDAVDHARYIRALIQEMTALQTRIGERKITSIFFGGGTPSLMQPQHVAQLIETANSLFGIDECCEITLEANPTSVEAGRFAAYRLAGVNRVSIGVQSLESEQLRFLGREHSADEAQRALMIAAETFPRYSFDLIYALPGQTPAQWTEQLTKALTLAGGHLSLYQLTIEENTGFYHDYHYKRLWELPPEEQAESMYTLTQNIMEAHGLPAYEISNHAKPGEASRHNLTYWNYGEYAGVGPGAHGRIILKGLHATRAVKSPERWLELVEQHGHGMEEITPLDETTQFEERLMMRLRLCDEVPYHVYMRNAALEQLEAHGLATLGHEGFTLTPRGRLLLTSITAFLLEKQAKVL